MSKLKSLEEKDYSQTQEAEAEGSEIWDYIGRPVSTKREN
jgi:hypothetical protein